MHPILFHIGGVPVHTYGVMGAVGFLVAALTILRRTRALFLNRDHVVDVIFWTSLASLVGARVLYVLQNPQAVDGIGSWFNLRAGGLVFYGALLTGVPVAALVARWRRIPFLLFMDVVATAAPLAHGLARLGCLGAGCCWGGPTALPWGVTYSHPLTDAPHGMALHPTQAYEALGLFAIAGIAAWRYPRRAWDGEILGIYLLGYAVLRFFVEMLRGDARGWFLEGWLGPTLSSSQGVSLLVVAAALGVMAVGYRRARRVAPVDPAA